MLQRVHELWDEEDTSLESRSDASKRSVQGEASLEAVSLLRAAASGLDQAIDALSEIAGPT